MAAVDCLLPAPFLLGAPPVPYNMRTRAEFSSIFSVISRMPKSSKPGVSRMTFSLVLRLVWTFSLALGGGRTRSERNVNRGPSLPSAGWLGLWKHCVESRLRLTARFPGCQQRQTTTSQIECVRSVLRCVANVPRYNLSPKYRPTSDNSRLQASSIETMILRRASV